MVYYISREMTRNVYWSLSSVRVCVCVCVCACVCLCVCVCIAAFSHYYTYPDVTWGMVGVPSSCALMGGFAIGERGSLLWQHSAEREMSASACTPSMTGFALVRLAHTARTELHWTQLNLFRTADSSSVRLSSCNVNDVGVRMNSTVATLALMLYHFWATGTSNGSPYATGLLSILSCL